LEDDKAGCMNIGTGHTRHHWKRIGLGLALLAAMALGVLPVQAQGGGTPSTARLTTPTRPGTIAPGQT